MAKNGFKLVDAEMHVMEPVDLWARYIDPEFKARAPRRLDERRWDIRTIVEGEVMAQIPGGDWPALSDVEEIPRPRCGLWTRKGSIWRSCFQLPRCT